MKTQIREIEARDGTRRDGFYPPDGLEDMYRPSRYEGYSEARKMGEAQDRYTKSNCVVLKRYCRRYTHA